MASMFSYVIDHDTGVAPNPEGRYCTLAACKFGSPHHRNIVELAEKGDWIVGTGGASSKSSGHGTLIYAMRVDEILALQIYTRDSRFKDRQDALFVRPAPKGHLALISEYFYYFGRNAIQISSIPLPSPEHDLEKHGPGFRRDFEECFIAEFASWFCKHHEVGHHGEPCCPHTPIEKNFHSTQIGKCGSPRKPLMLAGRLPDVVV